MQRIGVILDPDDEKLRKHAEYIRKIEAARLADEERSRHQRELQNAQERMRKEAEKDQKREDKKLGKSKASMNCPSCNRPFEIKDLRSGSKHCCPYCNQVVEIE